MPKSSGLLVKPEPSLRAVPRSSDSLGTLACRLAEGYGLKADEWQADIVEAALGRRKNGRYSAATVGQAVPRQNGKNGWIEVRELFGMVALGEKFLHTAHEVKTARKAFRRIASFFENERQFPELAALVKEIRKTNGQEAIVLSNGGGVEFIARSSGSGRGFTVDVLVCDEAQDLTDDELAALLPTISAAPLGNPQVLIVGTPPDPEKAHLAKGEVFRRVRAEAQAGTDKALAFIDYGVPDGPLPDVDDRALWYRHNPALGIRLNVAEVERERKLMSAETFARERLGWWGDPRADKGGAISIAAWSRLVGDCPPPESVCLVIDVSPDRRFSSIGIAGDAGDGRTLVMTRTAAETNWVVDEVVRLVGKGGVLEVALQPQSQAGALIPELTKAGIEFVPIKTTDAGQACAAFQTSVKQGGILHAGQPELDAAVMNARTRYVTEAELWDRRDRRIDISPLVACSNAAFRWALIGSHDYDVLDSIF